MLLDKEKKKGLLISAVIIAGIYLIYKKFYYVSNTSLAKQIGVTPPNEGGDSYISKASMTKEQYNLLAEKVFNAFSGYGTDFNGTNGLKNIFSLLRNNDDLMELIAAYGIREVSSGSFNPIPDFTGNLPEVLSNELSQKEISEINSILVKNNINIRFTTDGTLTTI
jgi:hypothetical protein